MTTVKCSHCDGLGLVQAVPQRLDEIDRMVANVVGLSSVKKMCRASAVNKYAGNQKM
jgi:hypothetical protein